MNYPAMALAMVAATGLIVAGCAAEDSSAVPRDVAAEAKRQAAAVTYERVAINTDAGAFWFEPARCSIDDEDGAQHFDIHGPGMSPDGKPVYVTIDGADQGPLADGDMRIHVGVDAPFTHGDPAWISNHANSFSIDVPASTVAIDGGVVTISGLVFAADGDARLQVTGPVRVDCRR